MPKVTPAARSGAAPNAQYGPKERMMAGVRSCPTCGQQNPDGVAVCLGCAATRSIACPQCGHVTPAGIRFCGQCGSPLGRGITLPAPPSLWQGPMADTLRTLMPAQRAGKITAAGLNTFGERHEVRLNVADIFDISPICNQLGREDAHVLIEEATRLPSAYTSFDDLGMEIARARVQSYLDELPTTTRKRPNCSHDKDSQT